MPRAELRKLCLESPELWEAVVEWVVPRWEQAAAQMEDRAGDPAALEWRGRKRELEALLDLPDQLRLEDQAAKAEAVASVPPPPPVDDGM